MRRIVPTLLVTSAVLLAACSSAGSDSGGATSTTAASASTRSSATATGQGHQCDQGASQPKVTVAPVPGVASDRTMTAVDGTKIRLHWFPLKGASKTKPAPTILEGPGWSLAGDTASSAGAIGLFGGLSIPGMWDAGYNVLTWDPRGFGKSDGKATVDAPDAEGRDVQQLLDFVATQPEAQLDGTGDPRVGMVGMSYGGGIQLTTASIDCRVDALVPGLSWHSLKTGLYKADTVKTGWSNVLTSTADPSHLDPHIVSATKSGLHGDGTLSDDDYQWFLSRGPGDNTAKIDVPTLFVQGTVDNLFTLDEATTNYEILRKHHVPTAMLWFCGGHGVCLTKPGDPDRISKATFAWLDKYLTGTKTSIDADQHGLDLVDQDGARWTAAAWPVAKGTPVEASGSGTLTLKADGGSANPDLSGSSDIMAGVAGDITPAKATNAVNVPVAVDSDALALGAPKLTFTYSGQYTGDVNTIDGRVYAQLVDDETGVVVGNQITPIKVTLDGQSHSTSTLMEIIAHHLTPGHSLTLQLVAATAAYGKAPLPGTVAFKTIAISIPTAAPKAVEKG